MRFPFALAAQAVCISALSMKREGAVTERAASPARVLITNPGNIYLADYDGSSFKTTMKQSVSGNPTWVAFTNPDLLYAVNEDGSDTRLFHLNVAGNTLGPEQQQYASSGVVHLAFSSNGTRMVGAGYGSANVDVWDVSNGGLKLKKTISSGNSPSNPHQANLDPSGRFFAVNDLGADQVFIIDTKNDAFNIVNRVQVTPGSGPRHGAFYPAGGATATHYMLLCEEGNIIIVFDVSYANDKLGLSNPKTYSSFGSQPTPSGAAAGELILTPDSQHLYVSNRLTGGSTDNIAHFSISQSSSGAPDLQFVGLTSTGGMLPRMFSLSTNGQDLLIGNEGGALGVVALRRGQDGALESQPRASISMSEFGSAGPKYVKQIA